MKPRTPSVCPVCGGRLWVTGLVCKTCGTEIRGEFEQNEFATLLPEQLEFLRMFLKARGNLKELERTLGVSYPTVRARFDALLRALGYEEGPDLEAERRAILDALERGELTPEEAAERLDALKRQQF